MAIAGNYQRRRLPQQAGFSLIEVLLVLALIAGIGALIATNIFGQNEKAKVSQAKIQVKKIAMAVDTYYIDTGNLPSKLDELLSGSNGTNGWDGPYIKDSELKDPWDQPFQFKSPGEHGPYDIMSYGADRKSGGDGRDADIGNWMS
ncbi:MAG: type II secretion system major pseudopilin GspG [Xanthomonadales bacterium]|nr:type II secretion system major pseudopilin GspG [Xanthomonadales bacterium]